MPTGGGESSPAEATSRRARRESQYQRLSSYPSPLPSNETLRTQSWHASRPQVLFCPPVSIVGLGVVEFEREHSPIGIKVPAGRGRPFPDRLGGKEIRECPNHPGAGERLLDELAFSID